MLLFKDEVIADKEGQIIEMEQLLQGVKDQAKVDLEGVLRDFEIRMKRDEERNQQLLISIQEDFTAQIKELEEEVQARITASGTMLKEFNDKLYDAHSSPPFTMAYIAIFFTLLGMLAVEFMTAPHPHFD